MVYAEACAEMELESRLQRGSAGFKLNQSHSLSRPLDGEDIFISQLRQRAQLLNDAFQERLIELLKRHSAHDFSGDKDEPRVGVAAQSAFHGWRKESSSGAKDSDLVFVDKSRQVTSVTVTDDHDGHIAKSGNQASLEYLPELADRTAMNRTLSSAYSLGDSVGTGLEIFCAFCCDGGAQGLVSFHPAPPKTKERMREKLAEYVVDGAEWPLAACILDPIRASVVCETPAQMLEVAGWFLDQPTEGIPDDELNSSQLPPEQVSAKGKLRVCRVKNKFAIGQDQLVRADDYTQTKGLQHNRPHSCPIVILSHRPSVVVVWTALTCAISEILVCTAAIASLCLTHSHAALCTQDCVSPNSAELPRKRPP